MRPDKLIEFTFYRGRVALYAMLQALDIRAGDEIAIQAFTCIAVPEAVMATGAVPIFVDIEDDGFNMSASDLSKKVSKKTKCIVIQHTYGIPADMDAILEVAHKHQIPIIEDCCHAILSEYNNKRVGTFGIGSFYSYEWGKPVIIGIGGSAVINDRKFEEKFKGIYETFSSPPKVRMTRLQLQYLFYHFTYSPSTYWKIKVLFNFLGKIGAAEGNYNPMGDNVIAKDFRWKMSQTLRNRLKSKLIDLTKIAAYAEEVASKYRSELTGKHIRHPKLKPAMRPFFARYPILTNNKKTFLEKAKNFNIELSEWYSTPIHPLKQNEMNLVHYQPGSCKNAEMRCSQVVTLPVNRKLNQPHLDKIISFFMKTEMH